MVKRYEVWFQYNKTGNYRFESLKKATSFAKKFKKNRPLMYDLIQDKQVYSKDIQYFG
jgi:hypothetical protein